MNLLERLREEIALAESNLAGAMRGISDGYLELHNGGGRGHSVHAQYQESNMRTGKPLADLAVELAAWASEIAAKSAALDVRRTLLKQFEEEG
ncbi:hypothetical protein [Kitasatospora sp. NPDC005751]|uniref:hypothetical protein n=1 Tax=unclassified Kitasatospora TaxID=2633591 RepID=UPI0033C42144